MAASCPPTFAWANNNAGRDPCAVASSLKAICQIGSQPIHAIGPGGGPSGGYQPPTRDDQTQCTCSSVFYAVIAGCADCQGAPFNSWPNWSRDCTSVSRGFFPFPVSGDSEIPVWATFNPDTQPRYDRAIAQVAAQSPPTQTSAPSASSSDTTSSPSTSNTQSLTTVTDTTSDPFATSTSNTTSTTVAPTPVQTNNASFSLDPDNTTPSATDLNAGAGQQTNSNGNGQTTSSNLSEGKKPNTGAIAGGVVGGLLVLALIAGLVYWWVIRRRRSRVAPSAAYIAAYGTVRPDTNMSMHRPFASRSNTPLYTPSSSDFTDGGMRESTFSTAPSQQQVGYSGVARESSPGPGFAYNMRS